MAQIFVHTIICIIKHSQKQISKGIYIYKYIIFIIYSFAYLFLTNVFYDTVKDLGQLGPRALEQWSSENSIVIGELQAHVACA